MRAVIAGLIAAPLAFAALPAWAQSSPSADQIIQSLKPSGNLLKGETRGIRVVNPDAGPAATAPAPAQSPAHGQATAAATAPAAAAQPSAAPAVSLTVEFGTGSDELTPQARATLDALGKALSSADLAKYRFRIEGHTDTVGSPGYNQALSQRRAEAVARYLESSFGVASARLEAVGMGEQGLLVPTPPQTPNAQNRRVKVVNLGG
ncbi:MAG: OmpA family protein [Alphaproteobacteria bacterium]|nr:OmpA family protein [Alphaproteobacteria bacterium]